MNSHYGRVGVLRCVCVCDLHNVSRLALSSVDMEQRDYDQRTALHVAAAEGEALQKKQTHSTPRFIQRLSACRTIKKPYQMNCCRRHLELKFNVQAKVCFKPGLFFQDTRTWCASWWRPAGLTQRPKTGGVFFFRTVLLSSNSI